MKHNFKNICSMILIGLISMSSFAEWDVDASPKTVKQIGVYGESQGFVTLNEGVHENCVIGHLYFDLLTPKEQAMYSTLLAAHISKQSVRVSYNFGNANPGKCILDLVSLK